MALAFTLTKQAFTKVSPTIARCPVAFGRRQIQLVVHVPAHTRQQSNSKSQTGKCIKSYHAKLKNLSHELAAGFDLAACAAAEGEAEPEPAGAGEVGRDVGGTTGKAAVPLRNAPSAPK